MSRNLPVRRGATSAAPLAAEPDCPACGYLGALTADGHCPRCNRATRQLLCDRLRAPVPLGVYRTWRRAAHRTTMLKDLGVRGSWRLLVLAGAGVLALAALGAWGLLVLLGQWLFSGPPAASFVVARRLLALGLAVPVTAVLSRGLLVAARAVGAVALDFSAEEVDALPSRVPITDAWSHMFELRGRRALSVHAQFRTDLLDPGTRVAMQVRLRWMKGPWLEARLPLYRGSGGELVARELSDPVGETDDVALTVGTLIPLQAVDLPEVGAGVPMRLEAEIRLLLGVHVQDRHLVEVEFLPREVDYRPPPASLPPATPAGAGYEAGVEIVSASQDLAASHCRVCGDPLEEPVVRCSLCTTPHHEECWRWVGRCSTYACRGSPALQEAEPWA